METSGPPFKNLLSAISQPQPATPQIDAFGTMPSDIACEEGAAMRGSSAKYRDRMNSLWLHAWLGFDPSSIFFPVLLIVLRLLLFLLLILPPHPSFSVPPSYHFPSPYSFVISFCAYSSHFSLAVRFLTTFVLFYSSLSVYITSLRGSAGLFPAILSLFFFLLSSSSSSSVSSRK